MAENYNIGSKFGLNVSSQGNKSLGSKNSSPELSASSGNLFDYMVGNESSYEKVFNGEVTNEINMLTRQAMLVGMNLRAADVRRHFDMNI